DASPPYLHIFRGGLRGRGDDCWQSDGGVAVHVGSQSAAFQFSVNQRFIEGHDNRTPTGMGSIGSDLNRVLVSVNLLFEDVDRGHFSLTQETFGNAAAKIDYT